VVRDGRMKKGGGKQNYNRARGENFGDRGPGREGVSKHRAHSKKRIRKGQIREKKSKQQSVSKVTTGEEAGKHLQRRGADRDSYEVGEAWGGRSLLKNKWVYKKKKRRKDRERCRELPWG